MSSADDSGFDSWASGSTGSGYSSASGSQDIFDDDDSSFHGSVAEDETPKEEAILFRRLQEIRECSDILSIPKLAAGKLLEYVSWNKNALLSRFVDDADRLCKEAEVELRRVVYVTVETAGLKTETECLICMTACPANEIVSLGTLHTDGSAPTPCQHFVCSDCWRRYLMSCIDSGGAACIQAKCPGRSAVPPYELCTLMVPETLFDHFVPQVASSEYMNKYNKEVVSAFVQQHPQYRWCAEPSCSHVVFCADGSAANVCCPECHHRMCFRCGEETHQPATCGEYKQATAATNSNAINRKWIEENTKACPRCKTAIEKTSGCDHMRCTRCAHQFCWICSKKWRRKEDTSSSNDLCSCHWKPIAQTVRLEQAKTADEHDASISRQTQLAKTLTETMISSKEKMQECEIQLSVIDDLRSNRITSPEDRSEAEVFSVNAGPSSKAAVYRQAVQILLEGTQAWPSERLDRLSQAVEVLREGVRVLRMSHIHMAYTESLSDMLWYQHDELERAVKALCDAVTARASAMDMDVMDSKREMVKRLSSLASAGK